MFKHKDELAIKQNSDNKLTQNFTEFCLGINVLCARFDLSITSWFRSDSYNGKIGGKEKSLFTVGMKVEGVLDYGQKEHEFIRVGYRLGLHCYFEDKKVYIEPYPII